MFPFHLHLFGKYFFYFEGIYYLISIFIGFTVAKSIAQKNGIDKDQLIESIAIAFISGFLGARIFQELFYSDTFQLTSLLSIWKGGLSITGGVILGPIFTYLICKWKKINYWKTFTIVSPSILITQGIGRIGCFLNGDGFGKPTDSIFGTMFPKYGMMIPDFKLYTLPHKISEAWEYSYNLGLVDEKSIRSAPLHPTQLYEAFLDFGFGILLLFILKNILKHSLDLRIAPSLYIAFYSFIRVFIEFFRTDSIKVESALLSNMQWVLVGTFIAASIFAFRFYKNPKIIS